MRYLIPLFVVAWMSGGAFAHDEGHGPKLTDSGRQGGVVSPVIDAKDAKKGAKADLVYKSELVRSEDGTVRIYLYDKEMKPLVLDGFSKKAEGILSFKKGKKWTNTRFELTQTEGAFVAQAPKAGAKPFNIDFHVNEGERKLLAAFDNLD